MKIKLKFLELHFRKSTERIEFDDVNFFWGKIGAGKSSIARLIDFCLGADIHLTPALQLEFIQAALFLEVEDNPLAIYRERDASKVVVVWKENDETLEALIPARNAEGIAVPGTFIEVLSDLIFHLANLPTPKVRRGRQNASQTLARLSLRDLLRFCYLDQDGIDSEFFRLDPQTDWARRNQSASAVRYILGYHQDQVAALENELQTLHEQKLAAKAAAEALKLVLHEAGFSDPDEIDSRIEALSAQRDKVRTGATAARENRNFNNPHAVDMLRQSGRALSTDLRGLEEMFDAIQDREESITRHLNELKMLSVRFSRTKSARTLLAAVDYIECPRCTQTLPERAPTLCPVCGQVDSDYPHEHLSDPLVEADLKSRLAELQETLQGIKAQKPRIAQQLERVRDKKATIDQTLEIRLRDYDSAFLSRALEFERQATSLEQEIGSLLSYRKLPERLTQLLSTAESLNTQEVEARAKLAREREKAFKDRTNLEELEKFFLDCLVRSSFPGITETFKVSIDPKTFMPEVFPVDAADFAVTSFSNMGSGGMKTIFKACYAIAVQRLAAKTGAALPTLLIIDSAMKNVSERENIELFQSFYGLVYELANGELSKTQFILIDKEMFSVPEGLDMTITSRHMQPGSREHPPLVPYYNVFSSP
jgi:rubrerythrin